MATRFGADTGRGTRTLRHVTHGPRVPGIAQCHHGYVEGATEEEIRQDAAAWRAELEQAGFRVFDAEVGALGEGFGAHPYGWLLWRDATPAADDEQGARCTRQVATAVLVWLVAALLALATFLTDPAAISIRDLT